MVTDRGRDPETFPEAFSKGYCRLPYVLITIKFVTLVPVHYSTFLYDVVPVLAGPPGFY